jgi:hypothetical protein
MTPLGHAALALAAKGLRVFPCIERAKEPAIADNLRHATTDPNTVAGWWRTRDFNIGIATGPESGVWALDIDSAAGEGAVRMLEAKHGALPATVKAITGKGRHLYFRWPGETEVRNREGMLPGIDARGIGGYVLAPPSVHPSGRRYAWSVDSASEFADAPQWLLELVINNNAGNKAPATSPEAWRKFINDPVEGSRRSAAIARLYGLLVRRFIDPIAALDIARMFNELRCRPPLDDDEVVRIVTDITRREKQRRECAP